MVGMTRPDGRQPNELRPLTFERDYTEMSAGSVLVSFGKTRVLCTASIDEDVPRWMKGSGKGWVTAEYSMLPGSSPERVDREAAKGKQSGRTVEIQRLIGRSLRAACDMKALGERQVVVDCDVLQADGGTRTASISGAYVALSLAVRKLMAAGKLAENPVLHGVAAVSVGICGGAALLDLCYTEDASAAVDFNLVMNSDGEFIELQGTGEEATFTDTQLAEMLKLGKLGLKQLFAAQQAALAPVELGGGNALELRERVPAANARHDVGESVLIRQHRDLRLLGRERTREL